MDSDLYKNDFIGYYYFRLFNNLICVFKLVRKFDGLEFILNNDIYGNFLDFGGIDNLDLSYMIVEWRLVFVVFG